MLIQSRVFRHRALITFVAFFLSGYLVPKFFFKANNLFIRSINDLPSISSLIISHGIFSINQKHITVLGYTKMLNFPQIMCLEYEKQRMVKHEPLLRMVLDTPEAISPYCEWIGFIILCPKILSNTSKFAILPSNQPIQGKQNFNIVSKQIVEDSLTTTLAVCVGPLSNYADTRQLLLFVFGWRLLGAAKINIYVQSCVDSVWEVLLNLNKTNLVSLILWPHLPILVSEDPNSKVHYNGQVLAYNDCLYRSKGNTKYLAFADLDEFIILEHNVSFLFLLQRWTAKYRHVGAFKFKVSWINISDVSQQIFYHLKGSELILPKSVPLDRCNNVKYGRSIILVERVLKVTVNGVTEFLHPFSEKIIDCDAAMVYHARTVPYASYLNSGSNAQNSSKLNHFFKSLALSIRKYNFNNFFIAPVHKMLTLTTENCIATFRKYVFEKKSPINRCHTLYNCMLGPLHNQTCHVVLGNYSSQGNLGRVISLNNLVHKQSKICSPEPHVPSTSVFLD
jgi:Glycosyltransferase family 92